MTLYIEFLVVDSSKSRIVIVPEEMNQSTVLLTVG